MLLKVATWPIMACPQTVCHQVKSSVRVRGVIILFEGVDVDLCLIDVFGVVFRCSMYINSKHNFDHSLNEWRRKRLL